VPGSVDPVVDSVVDPVSGLVDLVVGPVPG